MILTRKLLTPTLGLFAILLAGLFIYFFSNLHEVYHEAEERDLASFSGAFLAEVENQKKLALALGADIAGNPNIQESFGQKNRMSLLNLVTPGLSSLEELGNNIVVYRFHFPDGSLFLDARDPTNSSANETSTSSMVQLATGNQSMLAGLEADSGDLGIRGIMPIYDNGAYVGSVEFGIGLNESLLAALRQKYGGEWHILLLSDFVPQMNSEVASPNPSLTLFATTQDTPLFNVPESYEKALGGSTTITHPSIDGRDYAILSEPLLDYSGRIIGVLDIVYDHSHISAVQNTRLVAAGVISFLALIVGAILLTALTRRTLQPIQLLTHAAAEIAEGNVASHVSIEDKNDEIGVLVRAFNRMTAELRGSIVELEQRVSERTRDLENQTLRLRVAAEIARDALSARDLGGLLDKSTQLILDRFKLYHVGIFLIDKNKEFVSLNSSPTEAGKKMIAERFRVAVGDPSLVGRVAISGEPQVNLEIRDDFDRSGSPLLPDAKSEIAVPLKDEERVLGVLDIQSDKPQAFKQNDVAVMQILADQLATAIERARLSQEVSQTLEELERSYGRYTREGWQNLANSGRIKNKGYRFNNIRIEPAELPAGMGGQAPTTESMAASDAANHSRDVSIPIKLRGQIIGAVHARLREGSGDNTINTLELAVERLASALESARLYEEASFRADREQAISQITNAISSSSEYETIMRTTVRELGNILSDTEVAIQILNDNGDNVSPYNQND